MNICSCLFFRGKPVGLFIQFFQRLHRNRVERSFLPSCELSLLSCDHLVLQLVSGVMRRKKKSAWRSSWDVITGSVSPCMPQRRAGAVHSNAYVECRATAWTHREAPMWRDTAHTYSPCRKYWNSKPESFVFTTHWWHLGSGSKRWIWDNVSALSVLNNLQRGTTGSRPPKYCLLF